MGRRLRGLGAPPGRRAAVALADPLEFGAAYPVPSTALSDANFSMHSYWRGPTWYNVNWLVFEGLRLNGMAGDASALRKRSVEMVHGAGFHEYFSPVDGAPHGSNNFSWTAALVLETLQESPSPGGGHGGDGDAAFAVGVATAATAACVSLALLARFAWLRARRHPGELGSSSCWEALLGGGGPSHYVEAPDDPDDAWSATA